jgi:hypothetical protein
VALSDIEAGEEIVENYSKYKKTDIEWIRKLLERYDQGRIDLEENIRIK